MVRRESAKRLVTMQLAAQVKAGESLFPCSIVIDLANATTVKGDGVWY